MKQKGEPQNGCYKKTGVTRKQRTQNFRKKEHFVNSDKHTRFEIRPFAFV